MRVGISHVDDLMENSERNILSTRKRPTATNDVKIKVATFVRLNNAFKLNHECPGARRPFRKAVAVDRHPDGLRQLRVVGRKIGPLEYTQEGRNATLLERSDEKKNLKPYERLKIEAVLVADKHQG